MLQWNYYQIQPFLKTVPWVMPSTTLQNAIIIKGPLMISFTEPILAMVLCSQGRKGKGLAKIMAYNIMASLRGRFIRGAVPLPLQKFFIVYSSVMYNSNSFYICAVYKYIQLFSWQTATGIAQVDDRKLGQIEPPTSRDWYTLTEQLYIL